MQRKRFLTLLAASLIASGLAQAQNPSQFQWLNANSTFQSNREMPQPLLNPFNLFLAAGDVDSDNDVDFVSSLTYTDNDTAKAVGTPVSSSYDKFTNFPTGGCTVIDPFISLLSDGVLADFNNDGRPDMVGGSTSNGSLGVWSNVSGVCTKRRLVDSRSPAGGGWSFPLAATGIRAIVVADFDGNGTRDIVWGGPGGVRFVSNQQGPGTSRNFVTAVTTLTNLSVESLAAADFDGDGDIDLAVGAGTLAAPVHQIALNTGVGKFNAAPAALPAIAGFPLSVTAADIDADGDQDLVWGHQALITLGGAITQGGISVLTNNAGVFGGQQVLSPGVSFTGIAVGDIDEDGRADIVGCTRQEAGTVGGVTLTTTNGTRLFSRPAVGAAFADLSAARIGSDPAANPFCFDPNNPLADAIDPSTCLPLNASGVVLADYDLDLDLDIVVSYELADRIGVFTNLLWQLETARTSTVAQVSPGMWQWDIAYDLYCEFNVPNFGGAGGLGVVAVSLTPPTHNFPASNLGVLTTGNYVSGPTTAVPGQGQFVMPLGAFPTSTMLSLIGTRLFSTAGILSLGRNVVRFTKVTETTLQ